MKAPIETKVIAAASGAGLGGAFGTFLLWLLGCLAWGAPWSADKATQAVAAVPEPVGALIVILVALVGSAIGGYEAPHTPRPDLHDTTPVTTVVHNFTSAADAAKDLAAQLAFQTGGPVSPTSNQADAKLEVPADAPTTVSTPAEPEAPAAGAASAPVKDAILGKAAVVEPPAASDMIGGTPPSASA